MTPSKYKIFTFREDKLQIAYTSCRKSGMNFQRDLCKESVKYLLYFFYMSSSISKSTSERYDVIQVDLQVGIEL